jgi:two-component system NarL family response regulator
MERNENKNLTERELQVMYYVAEGLNNYEVAERMYLSVHTIKAHLESIYSKLSVHNKIQALVYAIKNKLINLD